MTTAGGARNELPDAAGRKRPDGAGGESPDKMPDQAAWPASSVATGPASVAAGQAGQEPARQEPTDGGPDKTPVEAHAHGHRDVSGGWLRPAVFGAMDGLVTNASLIAGVGGGGGSPHTLILTGLAGLAAGAFSMASGEFVSVSSQNELVAAEVSKERFELENHPDAERRELAEVYRQRGVDADLADRVARQVSAHPEQALLVHVREELGVDHQELPSPVIAAGASLVTFAAGALIPLVPYLAGFGSLAAALIFATAAAFAGGGLVARITNRPFLRGAVRQLALAAVATGLTYAIGALVGATVS